VSDAKYPESVSEKKPESYLAKYLAYFGDQRQLVVENLPIESPSMPERKHLELHELPPEPEKGEPADAYRHPCWCRPLLIYADDVRGNEVWSHNWLQ
jgi:hypothetical protein